MSLFLRFVAVFAAVGLLVSLVFGFLGGNPLVSIVVTALVSTLVCAGTGAGVYKLLELRVPELLEMFGSGESYLGSEDDLAPEGEFENDSPVFESSSDGDAVGFSMPEASSASAGEQKPDGVDGDHILVNKIRIKNEPKLIAQAIRTMLMKDND